MAAENAFNRRIAAVAAAALLSCACAAGCAQQEPEGPAFVRVDAPGWSAEASSPVVLLFTEEGAEEPLLSCAVPANEDAEVEIAPGDYQVEVISPINADGSTYDAVGLLDMDGAADEDGYSLHVTLTPIEADAVRAERIAEVLDGLARAVSVGDETLAGDAGRAVVERAAANASACPSVSDDEVEELAGAAEEAVSDKPSTGATTSGSAPAAAPGDASETSGSASTPAQRPSSDGSSMGGSSGGQSAGKPSHEHGWTAVTAQKWVVDQASWDEGVYEDVIICDCGLTWSSTYAWSDHNKQLMLNGGGCGYQVKSIYVETIHHEEVGHYETVTTGHRCSCGATK